MDTDILSEKFVCTKIVYAPAADIAGMSELPLFFCLSSEFAYGPADAAANLQPHHPLPHLNPDWFYLSDTGLPRLFWKWGH